ncbi:MAG: hypothetical protein QM737_01225 [Ferruginibacter sp.]
MARFRFTVGRKHFKHLKHTIMKMQSQALFSQLTKTTLSALTSRVEETLAKETDNGQRKIFSSADLWNIQRRRRSTVIR